MSLPKIDLPILEIDVVTLDRKNVRFRPFLVKEERILLTAKESSDENAHLLAVKQVVNNTRLEDVDVERLPEFDLEWIFLQLRANSISNQVVQTYEDGEDGKEYQVTIDLSRVKRPSIDGIVRTVDLPNGEQILLRFPPASLYGAGTPPEDVLFHCVEGFVGADGQIRANDASEEEFKVWFEMLPLEVSGAIAKFFTNIPSMEHVETYTNSKGTVRTLTFRSLTDFFDLR